ncbi:hypothetical protein BH18VER1_BH18VER1_15320 [soil metagenome]
MRRRAHKWRLINWYDFTFLGEVPSRLRGRDETLFGAAIAKRPYRSTTVSVATTGTSGARSMNTR